MPIKILQKAPNSPVTSMESESATHKMNFIILIFLVSSIATCRVQSAEPAAASPCTPTQEQMTDTAESLNHFPGPSAMLNKTIVHFIQTQIPSCTLEDINMFVDGVGKLLKTDKINADQFKELVMNEIKKYDKIRAEMIKSAK